LVENWSTQQERSNPFTLRLICGFARMMPRCITRLWLWPITLYFFLLAPKARAASRHYLKRVPGKRGSPFEVFQHLHSFASVVLDRVYFLTDKFDKFHIETQGAEVLTQALARGGGAILLGAHVGSFEVMRCLAIRHARLPLKIMMYHDHNAMITRVLDELNPEVARSVINLADHNALLHAKEALEDGAVIGMLGDRVLPEEKKLSCTLLGAPVAIPEGPMTLALLLGVPVIVFFGIYAGANRYVVSLELLYAGEKRARAEREAVLKDMTQKYVALIEDKLRQHPYNWFNFYDYWGDKL
jgi:predicted LPLAT superfamily acyltransferase